MQKQRINRYSVFHIKVENTPISISVLKSQELVTTIDNDSFQIIQFLAILSFGHRKIVTGKHLSI